MKKWNADLQIPTDSNYVVLVADAEVTISNAGNPMVVITTEIKTPSEVDINGESVNISGVKCRPRYYSIKVLDEERQLDATKTKEARNRLVKDFLGPIGLTYEDVNWENPDLSNLKGKAFYSVVKSNIAEKRKTPTQAQIEIAKKNGKRAEGDVMKNPITQQPLVQYWPETDDIFGLCEAESMSVQ